MSDFDFVCNMMKEAQAGSKNFSTMFRSTRGKKVWSTWESSPYRQIHDMNAVLRVLEHIENGNVELGVVRARGYHAISGFNRWLACLADNMTKEEVLEEMRPLWSLGIVPLAILEYSKEGLDAMLQLKKEEPSLAKDIGFELTLEDRKKGLTNDLCTSKAYAHHPPRNELQ